MSSETVYGRLESANRLVVEAASLSDESHVPEWWFSCAADAVASGDLEDADNILAKIDSKVSDQDVMTPIRNARQLITAELETWSQ